ncbi:hypothetical protein JL722_1635 [Aureococcus anophagefferens]|nr:hypothetical protein JL722_1635 [Aureococcus anophagefferens]
MDAQALKATGNAHFAKGEDQKAIDAYTAALDKTDDAPLRVAILSNRAACHLRLEAFAACVADCDGALALDGSKAKAYYRRARAREGLGELADAFRDLKACVRLEPANREAVALARSVKERLSATLKQEGAHESRACCGARARVPRRRRGARGARPRGGVVRGRAEADAAADAADEAAAAEEAALDIDDDAVVEDDGDASDDDADLTPARLRAAADGAAVVVVARALTSGTRRVRELGLDLLVRWLAPELSREAAKKKKGLAAMFEASKPGTPGARAEAKEKEDLRRCRARRLGKVLELPDGPVRRGVLGGLWALLDAKHDGERRKAQAAVARVCRAVARRGDPAQSDVEFEWDSPDEAAPASLVAALVAAGGVSTTCAVAKLGLAAKALKSGARETGRLLDSAVALLRDALKRKEEVAEGVGDGDDGVAAVERAVEVVAAMASASSVKEELAHGSGRCGAALPSLTALASSSKGSDPVAYGLSCVFANLTVTNDELRRRHFADKEMDITAEQYDELQRITKQKAEDDADTDTADLCGARCVKLAMADGVLALANLAATDPSPLTSEHLAATLVALAKDENLRGTLVQQGGFKAAVALSEAGGDRSEKCRIFAGHAAAKILVTTDPNRLTDAQRLAGIRPLLWLCKQLKVNDLVHFEALLGLTNLLSLGEISARARRTRASTRWSTSSSRTTTREDDEADGGKGDVQLARAAIGCLAMASEGDADVARAIADNRGKAALDHVLRSKEPSLVHRGAYCLANCLHDRKARLKLNDDDALMAALTQACDDLKQHTNAGLLEARKEAAECPARTDWHDQPSDDEGEEG